MDQYPLFLFFLDSRKVYDTVNHFRLLITLEIYCAGPHMYRLLAVFWDQQEVFTHQNGYHGPHFKSTRGTTQDGIISPTLFNLIVDNMVQNWLVLMMEDQLVAQEGLGVAVGRCMGIFVGVYCNLIPN